VEHGWQGHYYHCYEKAKEYGLKWIFGTEAYFVKDRTKEYSQGLNDKGIERFEKDRSNCHIIVLAKTELGRRKINDMLSTANEDGYYYKPRVDYELLMNLPPDDVFITTACIAFWKYEDIDEFVLRLHERFKNNFMLEIQNNNTDKQKEVNRHILELSEKYGIEMIVGLDSHYIYPEDAQTREYLLEAKNVRYPEEDGWYMDYPDEETVKKRFRDQGVFSDEEVQKAMDNSDITLSFEDIEFDKEIKLPTLYKDKTQEEKNEMYSNLIAERIAEYIKDFTPEEKQRYMDGVNTEVNTYIETGMVDYPLLDTVMVEKAIEKGGLITNTGRGSAVGYFTNTLCGFSKVDRFTSHIKLYPERFISKSRILETHSLPDLDLNCGTPEIFAEAQEELMGKDHAVPMISFHPLKRKSAFKMYARSQNLDFDIANDISKQIDKYEMKMKYADDDEKDEISVYDFIDKKYIQYVKDSEQYMGIIDSKSKAPCAYLLYQGSIREEIGLIKCKSESTKKEYITTVTDGYVAETYKFLKNDILKVDVVLLIHKIYEKIGIKPHTVNELIEAVKDDKKVWDLYKNGFTMGLNQCEKDSTREKVMKYKPQNVSELSAFVAAIRPAFKTMYPKFESRQPFDYGIPVFDKIIQTKEFPYSFILYQEQTMATLNYAGFPIDECYGIIKAIAKKHPEKVKPLKQRFIDGFKKKIIEDSNSTDEEASKMSIDVWQIIEDSCGYGFNSAHAYCMALDSLYNAWQKANYPYEFYEVVLQMYSDKGNKDKVTLFKNEMKTAFGISEGSYKFRKDNRSFTADKEEKCIYPSLASLKTFSQVIADDLYRIKDSQANMFSDLLLDIKSNTSVNKTQLENLIKIDYFSEFGCIGKLIKINEIFDNIYDKTKKCFKKQMKKEAVEKNSLTHEALKAYCHKETDKTYMQVDFYGLIKDIEENCDFIDISDYEKASYQQTILKHVDIADKKYKGIAVISSVDTKYAPKVTCYAMANGNTIECKISRQVYNRCPLEEGDVIDIEDTNTRPRQTKNEDGKWVDVPGTKVVWITGYRRKFHQEKKEK